MERVANIWPVWAMSKEKKDRRIMNLKPFQEQYVQVRRSPRHGVGLFAVQPIPKGKEIFRLSEGCWDTMTDEEFSSLPSGVQNMISMYCIHRNGAWSVPLNGLTPIDEIFFVNHSNKPNITTKNDGESFITTRRIKKGGEILLDYRIYHEDRPYLPGKG